MNPYRSDTRGLEIKSLASLVMLLIAASLPAQTVPKMPDPGKTSLSRQQQEQLGLQTAAEVYKQMPVLPDSSPITQYVQKLGKKLEGVIPPNRSWPYQFHVVPQKEINAFALPGGPIFINLGTIQAAQNEAQLAGVMAHEMSHVYMQHSAKQLGKAQWTSLLAGIAGAVMPQSGLGDLARMGIQFGAGTVLMKYSRTDEAQADAVGAIIMYKAGYNPKALSDFFTMLEKESGGGGPQFLQSHPNPGNREAAIAKQIRPWPPKEFLASSTAFAQAQAEAKTSKTYTAQEIEQGAKQGIWARENARSGALPANAAAPADGADLTNVSLRDVLPSNRFAQTQQKAFTISHPDNWQATGNDKSFLIAPPAGVSQAGIAYGVVIDTSFPVSGSLDNATQQIVQNLIKDNAGMRQEGEVQNVVVNGVEGRSVYLRATSPVLHGGQALPERDWLVVVPRRDGGVIYLVLVAPEQDFDQLRGDYQKMLDSLQVN
jgi:beta-barrel assembly-enhancing protease